MTYPLQVKAAQQTIVETSAGRIEQLTTDLAAASDPAEQEKVQKELEAAQRTRAVAEAEIAKLGAKTTNLVGLEKPLFELRNPGLISIPLGFLAVLLGSLFYRDKRAEEMWEELYVRSNTGIGRAAAAAH
jgi:cation/acetate symporter